MVDLTLSRAISTYTVPPSFTRSSVPPRDKRFLTALGLIFSACATSARAEPEPHPIVRDIVAA